MACYYGLLSMNYRLLWGRVAYHFRLLGVLGTVMEPAVSTPDLQIPMLTPTFNLPYINPIGSPKPLQRTPKSL